MRVRFIGQPYPDSEQLGAILRAAFANPAYDSMRMVVAWAKRSGLSRMIDSLNGFAARGGAAQAIVGLDEGGATWEGLQLAFDLFQPLYVYFDSGPRTFHSKVYVFEGPDAALVVVGSGNMTMGGLFTNYEAGLVVELEKKSNEDVALLGEVTTFYDRLGATPGACREIKSKGDLEALKEDPRIVIRSETAAIKARRRRNQLLKPGPSLFGEAIHGLSWAPPAQLAIEGVDDDDDDSIEPADEGTPEKPASGILQFWKALSAFDVSLGGAPGQIIIPIRYLDFFPTLEVQKDEASVGGVRQSHAEFALKFIQGGSSRQVPNARVILYEPARSHPRPNRELRFTFHERDIIESLRKDDILLFRRIGGQITVERLAPGSMGEGRWGT